MASQLTALSPAMNSCSNAGKASWTMLASSWPINPLIQVAPTTNQG